jgi:hypothetical protein
LTYTYEKSGASAPLFLIDYLRFVIDDFRQPGNKLPGYNRAKLFELEAENISETES